MSPSPTTPRHSRHSSIIDSVNGSPRDRRQSRSSTLDPSTPYANGLTRQDSIDLSVLNSGGTTVGNGISNIGNLADELADAFSDSGEEDEMEYRDGQGSETQEHLHDGQSGVGGATLDGGVITNSTSTAKDTRSKKANLAPPSTNCQGYRKRASEYDGSEYGSDSDMDVSGVPPSLVNKIDAIESLARRGTENYGGPADDVFRRVTEGLRELGSQSTVEGIASRLITAHSAVSTHLAHQTRQLHSLAFPILSPLAQTSEMETVDDLIPLLVSLSSEMPRPCTSAFDALTALHSITSELIQTLSYLSDSLHMSRQTTASATRKLKSAKELVSEMRRDEELREEGERWLTRGNWGQRLENRECAGVCGEVIGGFEDVCNGWRQRLLAQAEGQA